MNELHFRTASARDIAAIHRLIVENLEVGHLLPRSLSDVERHVGRFVVAERAGRVVGCADLAPLSRSCAEVRSLVVEAPARGQQIGPRLVAELAHTATARGFSTLCAFTHDPSHFVRLGFTIVPHIWVPEKIAHDCTSCPLFRRCGQYAVTLPLRSDVRIRPLAPAAVIYAGRTAAAPRLNVERLRLGGYSGDRPEAAMPEPEAVPA